MEFTAYPSTIWDGQQPPITLHQDTAEALAIWDAIMESLGLSFNDDFTIWRLTRPERGHPAGSLVVWQDETLYIQNPPDPNVPGLAIVEVARDGHPRHHPAPAAHPAPAGTALSTQCARCPELAAGRTCIVEGTGPFKPLLMVIGEAPGREEDEAGSPFVGASGKLLRASLAEFGLDRSKVYFTNAVRCRPEGNRNPSKEELDNCADWLRAEIERVNPRAILCVGKVAEAQVTAIVPTLAYIAYEPIPLYRAYHPAYILRNPRQRPAWLAELRRIADVCLGRPEPPPRPDLHTGDLPDWEEGPVDPTSPWLAGDVEYDDGEEESRTELVSAQLSDGRAAIFYRRVHDLAGGGGPQRLRADQVERQDGGSPPPSPGVGPGSSASAGDGREPHLSEWTQLPLFQQTASGRGDARREPAAVTDRELAAVRGTERQPHQQPGEACSASGTDQGYGAPRDEVDDHPGRGSLWGVPAGGVEHLPTGDQVRADPALDFQTPPHLWCHAIRADADHLGLDLWDLDSWDDTSLVAYVLRFPAVGLKTIGPELTGIEMTPFREVARKKVIKTKQRGTVTYQPGSSNAKGGNPYHAQLMHERKRHQHWCATEDAGRAWVDAKCAELGLATEVVLSEQWVPIPFSEALRLDPVKARRYALTDAVVTSRVARVLYARLEADPVLLRYYEEFEKPTVPVLADMERRGVRVDASHLAQLGERLSAEIATVGQVAADELGFKVEDLRSTLKLGKALASKGFTWREKTPTGQPQVNRTILLKLAGVTSDDQVDPLSLIGYILRFRELGKLKSTYVDALLSRLDQNGRIHGRFNQAVTDTNRLSSSDPNLQNIPARTELGREIRRAFIPKPGCVFVKADFSQLEVRIYAHYTGEPVLVQAYTASPELDVHQSVADELGIPRKRAKNVLFGAIYGADAPKLAETAGVVGAEATAFLGRLREQLPSLLTWQSRIAAELQTKGYVSTLFGWRNYYPLFWSPIQKESREALRQAANMPIQGTAGGILKLLFRHVRQLVSDYEAELVLTVHDEVVYEVNDEWARDFADELEDAATRMNYLSVPLKLEVEIGQNWRDTQPWREWNP